MLSAVLTRNELEKDRDGLLDECLERATAIVDKYCTFLIEADSHAALIQALQGTFFWRCLSDGGLADKVVGVWYFQQHAGESDCKPHCRMPAFRMDHLRQVTMAVNSLGLGGASIPENVIFFICHGGTNHDPVMKSFVTDEGKVHTVECMAALTT